MINPELSEGRFTSPTLLCLNPEYWHSMEDESCEMEVSALIRGLVIGLQPDLCIETGTAFGQTARIIGEALQQNGHGRLLSFEVLPERVAVAEGVCVGLPVKIFPMAAINCPDEEITGPIGFAFFDSSHADRIPEFNRFRKHLAPGAICAFHDSAPGHSYNFVTSQDLITQLRALSGVTVINLPTPRGIALLQVKA